MRHIRVLLLFAVIFICKLAFIEQWSEGFHASMDVKESEVGKLTLEKTHGRWPKCQTIPHDASKTRKRSFKRALRRTMLHGYTWYKGKLFTAPLDAFSPRHIDNTDSAYSLQDAPAPNLASNHFRAYQRLTIFSWNTGGLSQASWDNLQMWITHQKIDILMLQETHWRTTNEWVNAAYTCIHSAANPSRSGGLLTLISKKLIQQHLISWSEVIPGRLKWIRLHFQQRCLDLIHCYQHTWRNDNTSVRETFLDALNETVGRIPRRHVLYLAGDFHTAMPRGSEVIGVGTFTYAAQQSTGFVHSDWRKLHDLFQLHGLVALNTYDPHLGGTFHYPEGASRIDYILCRHFNMDTQAKQVVYIHQFPLLPVSGNFHVPLMTSVRKQWFHSKESRPQQWSFQSRKCLTQHWQGNTPLWQESTQKITHCFDQLHLEPACSAEEMHEQINEIIPPLPTTQAPSLSYGSPGLFKQFCECSKRIKCYTSFAVSCRDIFTLWHLSTVRHRLQKQMAKQSRLARKSKIQDILMKAQHAAESKDQYELYQRIRQLAPKQVSKRIQLRDDAGNLLSPEDSAALIAEWWQDVYQGPELQRDTSAPPWPFTSMDFKRSFAMFKANKALDNRFAPAVVWKAHAKAAAHMTTTNVLSWLQEGELPEVWSSGTLGFIPKAGKPMNSPSSLRPIALLEPTSKACMGALCHRLQKESLAALVRLPQFAYLCHRGCAEAICRIQAHCQQVRDLKFHHQYGIHQRAHGLPQTPLRGGLLISLDLTRAFDSVNRNDLISALEFFQISPDLVQLIAHLYRCATFQFQHRGASKSFGTSRGIRQGCGTAPVLWSIYMGWILHQYGLLTHFPWLISQNTVYADDWSLYDLFESPEDLEVLLLRVGQLFDHLESLGLIVNNKTVAIPHMQGKLLTPTLRRWVKRTSQGTFQVIPRANEKTFWVRLVKQHCYLGVTLSYQNFELQTIQHRIRCATKLSYVLQKWLTGREGLTLKHRLQVWIQCVYTSVIHGLFQMGLTEQLLHVLDVFCMKQLRRIARNPVHLTHLSHSEFLAVYQLPDPLSLLKQRCQNTWQQIQQRQVTLPSLDVLHTIPCDHLLAGLSILENYIVKRRQQQIAVQPEKTFSCSLCPKVFLNQALLRVHITKYHANRSGQLRVTNYLTDALNGLPTCSRCRTAFTQWTHFRYHVEWICVADLPQDNRELQLFREHQQRLFRLASDDFSQITTCPEICKHFLHRCVLCNKYEEAYRGMTKHLQREHPAAYAAHVPLYKEYAAHAKRLRVRPGHCPLCMQAFGQKHACEVTRQVAMLMAHKGLDPQGETTISMINDEGHPIYACDLCDMTFHDERVLQEHAVSHLADLAQFNALRDVTPDNHCRHCGSSFGAMHRVYRHIITKSCPVFDPNKTWTTFLDQHATLKQLVHTGNIQAILQNPDLLSIFDLTCTLCCRQFKRKNDLQAHLLNIHAQYWKQVEAFVLKLVNHYQGSAVNCYCTPKTKQWGKHQCSVFRQFALLRHVVFPELTNDHLIPRPMQSTTTEQGDEDSTPKDSAPVIKYTNIMDCLRRSSTTTMQPLPVTGEHEDSSPYPDFSSQEYMDDQELAENLERMLHQPHDTVMPLIDKVQLSFSGGGAIPCSKEFAQHLFPDVLPAAQPHLDIALGSDYQDMTADHEVNYFSKRCLLCNFQFVSPDEVWAHMSTHIIQMHPSISMYSLGTVLLEFLTVCNALGNTSQQKLVQAALKQQFALRVVALHHGRGRRQDESDDRSVETHPATRGPDDHEEDAGELKLQSCEKETASRTTTHVHQEGGHSKRPDFRSFEDAGSADAPTGESTEMSQLGSRVHSAHWLRRRRNLSRDGRSDSPMAWRREDRSSTLEVGTPGHEDHQSTSAATGPLPKRIRVVDPNGQGSSDLGNWRNAFLDMGQQDPEAGPNEAAT